MESLWPEYDLEKRAINLLQRFSSTTPYYVAFGGGKDSVVTLHLVKKAGVPYEAVYHVTGLDPHELVRFIKEHHPEIRRKIPRMTILDLAKRKGIVPTSDRLVELGDSVPQAIPSFCFTSPRNPLADPELLDCRNYPAELWAPPGAKEPNRAALGKWGAWVNAWSARKYGRPLFLAMSAGAIPLLAWAGVRLRWAERGLLLALLLSTSYLVDINFLSMEWYRGDTRGFEFGVTAWMIIALLVTMARSPRWRRPPMRPPNAIPLAAYLLLAIASVATAYVPVYAGQPMNCTDSLAIGMHWPT